MAHFEHHTTDRDRICRICCQPIERGEEALVLKKVATPKLKDLHFHTSCMENEMELLKGKVIRNDKNCN